MTHLSFKFELILYGYFWQLVSFFFIKKWSPLKIELRNYGCEILIFYLSNLSFSAFVYFNNYQLCNSWAKKKNHTSFMKFFLFAFIFSWLPALSFAAGGDECINSKPGDEKEFCIAKTRINSGNCEKISNGGLRSECLSYVKRSQRVAVWAIQPMDKNSIDIRTDSMKKYIWER